MIASGTYGPYSTFQGFNVRAALVCRVFCVYLFCSTHSLNPPAHLSITTKRPCVPQVTHYNTSCALPWIKNRLEFQVIAALRFPLTLTAVKILSTASLNCRIELPRQPIHRQTRDLQSGQQTLALSQVRVQPIPPSILLCTIRALASRRTEILA